MSALARPEDLVGLPLDDTDDPGDDWNPPPQPPWAGGPVRLSPVPIDEPPDDVPLLGEKTLIGRSLPEFLAEDPDAVRWFGPIVEGGMAAALGPPESFKTTGMVQLGLAGAAGGSWLGMDLGDPRPFLYVAAEKSRATVRAKFARMAAAYDLAAPVHIIHRAGVTFGDRASWDQVVAVVEALGPGTFVFADTVASLAGAGFDENSGRDMAVVLGSARRLCDAGATVVLAHHPSKNGAGTGGGRLRGHSSLHGEIDGTLEFTRPDRAVEAGIIRLEPKDGDLKILSFRWDRETFLLDLDGRSRIMTAVAVAEMVEVLYDGSGVTAERIGAEFPGHGRTVVRDRIAEAVTAGLIARIGRGPATRYVPTPTLTRPSRESSGPDSAITSGGRSDDGPADDRTDGSSGPAGHAERGSSGADTDRPAIVRPAATGRNRPSGGGGLYTPPVDDSEADRSPGLGRPDDGSEAIR